MRWAATMGKPVDHWNGPRRRVGLRLSLTISPARSPSATACDALCLVDVVGRWPALLDVSQATATTPDVARTSTPRVRRPKASAAPDLDAVLAAPVAAALETAGPRPATAFRFLVDAMMGGLAKKLRSCGIDVVYGTLRTHVQK